MSNTNHFHIDLERIPKNIRLFISDSRHDHLVIYADHKKCFDKLSKCPLQLPLPYGREEIDYLYEKLKWVGSRDGYNKSNNYDFDYWVDKYPKE